MNSNRQPKGIRTGGQWAPEQHAEAYPLEPQTGELGRSTAADLSAKEAHKLWAIAYSRAHSIEPDVASGLTAGRNLVRNPSTPPELLHSMLVKRDDQGRQITRAWFMDKPVAIRDALESVIGHPNTSPETLYVIARSPGHQPQSEAAKRRLKEMRRGAPLSTLLDHFAQWRKAARKGKPQK